MKRTTMQPPVDQQEWEERIKRLCYPKREDFLNELRSFHEILWDALLDAQVRTNEIVKTAPNKRAVKGFYPDCIRFHVHGFMSQRGVSARLVNEKDNGEDGEEYVWEQKILAGNGIAGNIKDYEYRVLKVFNGGLPPAVSQTRKDFYNQSHLKAYQPPLLPGYVDQDHFRLKPNIVYLWEIIKGRLNLYYAIPTHYSAFALTVLTPIPNPIEAIDAAREETTEGSVPLLEPGKYIASFHGPLRKVEPGDDDIR